MIIVAPIRGQDCHGSGEYQATRDNRVHNGIDYACYKDSLITAVRDGEVTKIGYPYNPEDPKKGHLRYVQITDLQGIHARYFYVDPSVKLKDIIELGGIIGKSQGLLDIYPGITDHIHFEVKDGNHFIDPKVYIGDIT